jgi:hypothetical protein
MAAASLESWPAEGELGREEIEARRVLVWCGLLWQGARRFIGVER